MSGTRLLCITGREGDKVTQILNNELKDILNLEEALYACVSAGT